MNNWIVTANAGKARIFSQGKPGAPYEEVDSMINDGVRTQIPTDQTAQLAAGKSIHATGAPSTQNGYEPQQTPQAHETELFARSLNDYLVKAHQEHRFDQLTLAASPEFLGVLRKFVEPKLGDAIAQEINKDYTQLNPRELQQQITNKLNS